MARCGPSDAAVALAPDVRAFVARSMVAHVATLSSRGRPFVTPLWFVDAGGVLYLTTAKGTRAARNVAHDAAVTLLFHGDPARRATRVVRMRATATCRSGMPPWSVLIRVAAKYYLAPRALAVELRHAGRWALRMRYYAQAEGGAGHLVVVPVAAEFLPVPAEVCASGARPHHAKNGPSRYSQRRKAPTAQS
jgi:hypothetical protein